MIAHNSFVLVGWALPTDANQCTMFTVAIKRAMVGNAHPTQDGADTLGASYRKTQARANKKPQTLIFAWGLFLSASNISELRLNHLKS